MFDAVHKHKRAVQIILALITLPFAFFGVDYYFRRGDTLPEVAQVGDMKITQAEFAELLRSQQERLRQQLGGRFDPAILDNPEVRFALLDQLVSQKLLQDRARRNQLRVTDGQLQEVIASIEAFQDKGQFSTERYRQMLASQNLSPLEFEERLRGDLLVAPLSDPIVQGGIVARAIGERYIGLLEQQREVAVATLSAAAFTKDVKVDDAAIKAYFDSNAKSFQTPEQARFESVVLTPDAVASQVAVEPAEVKAAYEASIKQFGQTEERTAAHILVAVKPDAKADEKAAAKKKADQLAAQVRANPAKFGDLAKQNSEDPGSAAQGGELPSFARGSMVKPFEDAVFAMKVGEIAGPIATDFGYHIIKLNKVTQARTRPFDEVKGQIEGDLKRQKSASKFAAAADQFQNLVYEQADTFQGVAKALGLKVQTSALVTRAEAQAIAMGSQRVVDALFSPESTQSKRNTEAFEVGPSTLMSARIVEYKPAAPQSLESVKEDIRKRLVLRAASEAAQKAGAEKLARLEKGGGEKELGLAFGTATRVSRSQPSQALSPEGMKRAFQLDSGKLPQYAGFVNEQGGYSILKLVRVVEPPAPDDAKVAAAGARLGEQIARELYTAYLASLKSKNEVKINQANFEKR